MQLDAIHSRWEIDLDDLTVPAVIAGTFGIVAGCDP